MTKIILLLIGATFLAVSGFAEPLEDPDSRVLRNHVTYVINPDFTHSETWETAIRVLRERAVEDSKRESISYSTSVQRAEVLEAYTLKPDGRRLDVPKNNYQLEVNSGVGEGGPVFSDWTTLSLVFPDVQVGDTLVLSYRITQTEPIFPGEFSVYQTWSPHYPYDDVRVVVDAPMDLPLALKGRQMQESSVEANGRRRTTWTWSNPDPQKDPRKNYSVWDPEATPGFAVSSFASYREIIEAYSSRATPKAAVTPRIARLAADIVGDVSDPRQQARRLYDWVATNITYAGNCVGVGAVVPHDTDFILDNLMGDCKDHATLLQALLAAKGIRSSQALVNAGAIYALPELPVVSQINHVITYLPEFDLFVDSTSSDTPFGMLPFAVEDKPVLLVGAERDSARTPAHPADADSEHVLVDMSVDASGRATGHVTGTLRGNPAVERRSRLRHATLAEVNEGLNERFRRGDRRGSIKLTYYDPQPLEGTFAWRLEFDLEEYAQIPGPAAFSISTPGGSAMDIAGLLSNAVAQLDSAPAACTGGKSVADYEIHLPKGVKVLGVPDDVSVVDGALRYVATHRVTRRVVHVHRELSDSTPGNVCSPAVVARQRDVALKALKSLRGQIVYK